MNFAYKFDLNRQPLMYLCNVDRSKIGLLKYMNLTADIKLNSYSELSFNIPYYYYDSVSKEKYVNPYYNSVEGLRYIFIEGLGYFQIQKPKISSDGIREIKEISAYSAEYDLTHKYINNISININNTKTDNTDSKEKDSAQNNDDEYIKLYDKDHPAKSILGMTLLEKFPEWSVGHIDHTLLSIKRNITVDSTTVYDFLVDDITDYFGCVIIFDNTNFIVNIYDEANYGVNTHINIDYRNLLKNADVSYSQDDIKTSLKVSASDKDFTIADINNGTNYITDISNYVTPEWMGGALCGKYKKYMQIYKSYLQFYIEIGKYISAFDSRIIGLETNRPQNDTTDPENFINQNFIDYGLKYLEEKITLIKNELELYLNGGSSEYESMEEISKWYNAYITAKSDKEQEIKKMQSVLSMLKNLQYRISQILSIKYFYNFDKRIVIFNSPLWNIDKNFNKIYNSEYFFNTMKHTKNFGVIYGNLENGNFITVLKDTTPITTYTYNYSSYNHLLSALIKSVLKDGSADEQVEQLTPTLPYKFFTKNDENIINKFIIESEYSDNNFEVLDNNVKYMQRKYELKKLAENELKRINEPSLEFSADLANPFISDSFKPLIDAGMMGLGNYINIAVRNDLSINVKLQEMHINFEDKTDFRFVFSNIRKNGKEYISHIIKDVSKVKQEISRQKNSLYKISQNNAETSKAFTEGFENTTDKLTFSSKKDENNIFWDKGGIHIADKNISSDSILNGNCIDLANSLISFKDYADKNITDHGTIGFSSNGILIRSNELKLEGTFVNNSLETSKENIMPYNNALDIINQSQIYQYNLKVNPEETEYGLVIGENYLTPDEVMNKNKDGIKLYSMLALTWGAIKELNTKLEQLTNNI